VVAQKFMVPLIFTAQKLLYFGLAGPNRGPRGPTLAQVPGPNTVYCSSLLLCEPRRGRRRRATDTPGDCGSASLVGPSVDPACCGRRREISPHAQAEGEAIGHVQGRGATTRGRAWCGAGNGTSGILFGFSRSPQSPFPQSCVVRLESNDKSLLPRLLCSFCANFRRRRIKSVLNQNQEIGVEVEKGKGEQEKPNHVAR
jgi:hypothetical protein